MKRGIEKKERGVALRNGGEKERTESRARKKKKKYVYVGSREWKKIPTNEEHSRDVFRFKRNLNEETERKRKKEGMRCRTQRWEKKKEKRKKKKERTKRRARIKIIFFVFARVCENKKTHTVEKNFLFARKKGKRRGKEQSVGRGGGGRKGRREQHRAVFGRRNVGVGTCV